MYQCEALEKVELQLVSALQGPRNAPPIIFRMESRVSAPSQTGGEDGLDPRGRRVHGVRNNPLGKPFTQASTRHRRPRHAIRSRHPAPIPIHVDVQPDPRPSFKKSTPGQSIKHPAPCRDIERAHTDKYQRQSRLAQPTMVGARCAKPHPRLSIRVLRTRGLGESSQVQNEGTSHEW